MYGGVFYLPLMMVSFLDVSPSQVTKVRVNALVGNTYHARVHYMRTPGSGGVSEEVCFV